MAKLPPDLQKVDKSFENEYPIITAWNDRQGGGKVQILMANGDTVSYDKKKHKYNCYILPTDQISTCKAYNNMNPAQQEKLLKGGLYDKYSQLINGSFSYLLSKNRKNENERKSLPPELDTIGKDTLKKVPLSQEIKEQFQLQEKKLNHLLDRQKWTEYVLSRVRQSVNPKMTLPKVPSPGQSWEDILLNLSMDIQMDPLDKALVS